MQEQRALVDPLVIRMDGTFDVPAAQHVAQALAAADAGRYVRIDLSRVREFHDFGVAVLAQALAARGSGVRVHGLGRHQRRILGYLGVPGVEPDATGAEAELF